MGRVTRFLLVRHVDGVIFFRSFEGTVFHGDFQFFYHRFITGLIPQIVVGRSHET